MTSQISSAFIASGPVSKSSMRGALDTAKAEISKLQEVGPFSVGTTGGTASAFTGTMPANSNLTLTDGLTALVRFHVRPAANASFQLGALTAKTIKYRQMNGTAASITASFPAGTLGRLTYSSTDDCWLLEAIGVAAREFWVDDFGGVGDNATDDYAAINAAITAAKNAGGGVVKLTSGKQYRYNTPIVIDGRAVVIEGDTRTHYQVANGANLIYNGPATGTWITIAGTVDGCMIRNVHLRKASTLTLSGGYAVSIAGVTWVVLENVKIAEGWNGVEILSSGTRLMYVNMINMDGAYGVRIYNTNAQPIAGTWLTNVVVGGRATPTNLVGFSIEGNVQTTYMREGCYVNTAKIGVQTLAAGGYMPQYLDSFETTCEGCSDDGFNFTNGAFFTFGNSRVLSSGLTAQGGTPGYSYRFGAGLRGLMLFTNCRAGSQGKHGYHILASAYAVRYAFIDCSAINCSLNTTNTDYGMFIAANATNVTVIGGHFGGNNWADISSATQYGGIGVGVGATGVVLVGVDLRGNVTRNLIDNGTGTKVIGCLGFVGEAQGSFTGSTDGSGNLVIPHGLDYNPVSCQLTLVGATGAVAVRLVSVGGVNINAQVYNTSTGAGVATTSYTVQWRVATARAL